MDILIKLAYNFFYIGAFSFGGGYAMMPLIQDVVTNNGWMTDKGFSDMIAISQITPGPIAINMATYVGYISAGPIGSCIATISVCLPSLIIVCLLMKIIIKYNENQFVKAVFVGLKPAVTGLIAVAAYRVAIVSIVDINELKQFNILTAVNPILLVIAGFVMFSIYKFKLHPIIYILIAGIVGAVLKL